MTNHNNFPIGTSDFKELIQKESIYVDKTLFIKEVMENHAKVILFTRPRRFGKTLNMSMLSYFLGIGEEDIFEGFKIKDHEAFCAKHQSTYPLLFLTFKDVKYDDFETAYSDIKGIFAEAYGKNRDLLEGDLLDEYERENFEKIRGKKVDDLSELGSALKKLIEFMHRKYKVPPILLLDEYDTPIQEAYMNNYYDKMISFMRTLLGSALKDNKDLGKAVLTGITRVSQESMFSGLNNIRVYTMLDEGYAQFFGFTEEEVESLLPDGLDIEPIKQWYNGYTIDGMQIYNPWSIINCLSNKYKLKPYWMNTSSNALVFSLIENGPVTVQEKFDNLLQGIPQTQTIDENLTFQGIEQNEDAIWTLLFHAGYLNILSHERNAFGSITAQIAVPNQEVLSIYALVIKRRFEKGPRGSTGYQEFADYLVKGNVEKFADLIRGYIQGTVSFFDLGKHIPEKVFHAFMLGILASLQHLYNIKSNPEAGKGRADMVMIPKSDKNIGIILEFKASTNEKTLEEDAREALIQIEDKKYTYAFPQNTRILMIGMAFCGKEMQAASKVLEAR